MMMVSAARVRLVAAVTVVKPLTPLAMAAAAAAAAHIVLGAGSFL